MQNYIPKFKKLINSNEIFVERALPTKGTIAITRGEKVEPFSKLGMAKLSYSKMKLPLNLSISGGKKADSYFYTNEKIGSVGFKPIYAPFDGQLVKDSNNYYFQQDPRDYWLLAGVWGEVIDIVDNFSVLLKTQAIDVPFVACTNVSFAGELIVFPNPNELLEMQYLEKFSKDVYGKVVYSGDHAGFNLIKRAIELGAGGVICGSASRETLNYAKQHEFFLGLFTGFGKLFTSDLIFDFLNDISSRYVFVHGDDGILRIPMPEKLPISPKDAPLTVLEKGILVQILEKPHFGRVGKVGSVQGREVYVILSQTNEEIKVMLPNLVSIE